MACPTASTQELEILFRDERYVAICKPSGLLVHRSSIDAHEQVFALQMLRDQIGQIVYPVHRLDKPTSGILLFALDPEALTAAKQAFELQRVEKTYEAIVRGFAPASGVIDRPLRKLLDRPGNAKSDLSQEAQTRFSTIARVELAYPSPRYATTRYSRLRMWPKTGRRHQIRRHLAGIDCPIIGDSRHGDTRQNQLFRQRYGSLRLWLHAAELCFPHPYTSERVAIRSSFPGDFAAALVKLGLTGSSELDSAKDLAKS